MWEDVTGEMTFELGLQIGVFQAEEGGKPRCTEKESLCVEDGGVKAQSP